MVIAHTTRCPGLRRGSVVGDTDAVILAGCHEPGHYRGGMVATIQVSE